MVELNRLISVAPMMDWTDRHYRFFMRCITRHVLLYTEMIHANAIVKGDTAHLLQYHPNEHPVAIQLGGSCPEALAAATDIAQQYGYDEVNLNVGCPSPRVQSGQFGACLMKQPALVATCFRSMQSAVSIPVTIKTRVGVDDHDQYDDLRRFVDAIATAGCRSVTVHARKAWLSGLSPKENRTIPPLQYDKVYQLKQDYPELEIILNGGVQTHQAITDHLSRVDGVMIGREAYHNPYSLADYDQRFFSESGVVPTRTDVVTQYLPYMQDQLDQGVRWLTLARPLLGLYHGQPHGKQWRRRLSDPSLKTQGIDAVLAALEVVGA